MIWRRLKKGDPKKAEEIKKALEERPDKGKDTLALLLSAFLTIALPAILILVAFGLLILFLFGGFF